jgi:C-terminal processing protease CtpA/Prc
MFRRPFPAALAAALLCLPTAPARAQDSLPVLTDAEKLYGLSLIWQEANYNFAYFDHVPALDWDSAYRAAIPAVLRTPSTFAYYEELEQFIALLGDGHTNVSLPSALQRRYVRSYPWVLTHRVAGRVLVRNVGTALAARLPIGSEIVAVDGGPVLDYAATRVVPRIAASTDHDRWDRAVADLLIGPAVEPVRIAWITPDGRRGDTLLARDRRTREDAWVQPIPDRTPRVEVRWLANGIVHVAVNTFNDSLVVPEFEALLPELRRARGLILDVRRNGGGNSGYADRIAAWLTDDTLRTQRWHTREHVASYKAWGRGGAQRYADYAAMRAWRDGGSHGDIAPADGARLTMPTVVLLDHATFSAAEDFLVAIDAIPHVTFVGRPSGGSTGQPLVFELPGGGRARICTKRDTYPDGREFVGVGVRPDVLVEPTVEDVRAGRDVMLARAAALLAAGAGRAGR